MQIEVKTNVEVVMCDVYIQSSVKLSPMFPPRTTEAKMVIQQLEAVLNQKIYGAIHQALEDLEAYKGRQGSGTEKENNDGQ